MKILFVGSNPSNWSVSSQPFCLGTKSGFTLAGWIYHLDQSHSIEFLNVTAHKTPDNRALTIKQIRQALPGLTAWIHAKKPDRIIALGKTAEKALTLLHLDFLSMPHPSGLNRQLNDEQFVKGKIKTLVEYCTEADSTRVSNTTS